MVFSKKKTLLISSCCGLGLLIIIMYYSGGFKSEEQPVAKVVSAQKLVTHPIETIQDITVQHDDLTLQLERDHGQWMMRKPSHTKANPEIVAELVAGILEWEGTLATANEYVSALQPLLTIQIGLEDKQEKIFKIMKKSQSPDLWVKDMSSENYYKLTAGRIPEVMFYARRLPDRSLLLIDIDSLVKMEFRTQGKTITMVKEERFENPWQLIQPENKPVLEEGMQVVLEALQSLEYKYIKEDSIWGKQLLSQYGLHRPAAKIALWHARERLPKELYFGRSEQGNHLYLKFAKLSRIYEIDPIWLSRFGIVMEDIQVDRKLIHFMSLITEIELDWLEQNSRIIKRDGKWDAIKVVQNKKTGKSLDVPLGQDNAQHVLNQLDELTYESEVEFESSDEEDFKESIQTGTLTFYTGNHQHLAQLAIFNHPDISAFLFVKRDNDGKIMILERQELEKLIR